MSAPVPQPPPQSADDQVPPTQQPAGRRSRGRLVVAVATVAVLALAILLVAVFFTGRKGGDTGTGVKPAGDHSIAARASGKQEAKFEVVGSAESLTVRCADIGNDLYRASTPSSGRLVPQATVNGDTTQLELPPSGSSGEASAEVLLSSAVRWQLKIARGGMSQAIDCSAGKLTGLELTQGAGTINLTLPKAQGVVEVLLSGGAGTLKVNVPQGPPVQVRTGSTGAGIGVLSVDGQVKNDVKPGATIGPETWSQAPDRFAINAVVGLASLTVDRR